MGSGRPLTAREQTAVNKDNAAGKINPFTKTDYILQQEEDIANLNKAVSDEEMAQKRLREQQKAILQAERAKRTNITTKSKRNTIKTGAQGITNKRQSMPSTIAGGNISDMPNSGMGTIVGG